MDGDAEDILATTDISEEHKEVYSRVLAIRLTITSEYKKPHV